MKKGTRGFSTTKQWKGRDKRVQRKVNRAEEQKLRYLELLKFFQSH